ncbi:hypothetical protein D3C76_1251150 [compost metagenome]
MDCRRHLGNHRRWGLRAVLVPGNPAVDTGVDRRGDGSAGQPGRRAFVRRAGVLVCHDQGYHHHCDDFGGVGGDLLWLREWRAGDWLWQPDRARRLLCRRLEGLPDGALYRGGVLSGRGAYRYHCR